MDTPSVSLFDEIVEHFRKEWDKLNNSYRQDLHVLRSVYQASGDPYSVVAVDRELEQIGSTLPLTNRGVVTMPSGLAALQKDYLRRLDEIRFRIIRPLVYRRKAEIQKLKGEHNLAAAMALERQVNALEHDYKITSDIVDQKHSKVLYRPVPEYPVEARRKHLMGKGRFLLHLDTISGKVIEVVVLQSTGYSILDTAAISALRRWRVEPHTVIEMEMPIEFRLGNN